MEDPYGDGAAIKAQEVQRLAKVVKRSGRASRNGADGAGADAAASPSLDDDLSSMSKKLLAWVETAAAAGSGAGGDRGEKGRVFPPVLLESCCRYMEALATAFPSRFAADCQSLARPVASCVLDSMTAHGAKAAAEASSPRQEIQGGSAAATSEKDGPNKSSQLPLPPLTSADEHSGPPPTTNTTIKEAESDTAREGNSGGCGAAQPSLAGASTGSITIEERKALELWVDMLGICLLPFCGSSNEGGTSSTSRRLYGADKIDHSNSQSQDPRTADREQADDPFDSDSEEEEDDEDHDDGEGNTRGLEGKMRSGWVAGWMRRAGVALAGPLECPLDVQPGGRDEDLPCRLAAFIASHAKAAAGASRPSSVSPLTTVLGVLVAFTASSPVGAAAATAERHDVGDCGVVTDSPSVGSCNGSPRYGHEIVVEEAFACLMGLAGAAPESSAQAECVKAALVALKECAQAARLSCLQERVPAMLAMLEGVPSRLKLLLTRSKSQGQKVFSTARSFCREALAAGVACARKLIGLAGAATIAEDSRWFLGTFVVKMASPLLLGDAVGALRAAAAAAAVSAEDAEPCLSGHRGTRDALEGVELTALREVILPGAVDRLTKVLGSIDRYSAAAAKDVLKATGWLVKQAGGEIRPYRNRLGMALVECAVASKGRSNSGGGAEMDEKVRLCLRAIRRLGCAAASVTAAGKSGAPDNVVDASSDPPATSAQSFPEEALDFTCGIVEKEWLGRNGDRGERAGSQNDEDDADESIITLVEAHVTLVALLRSSSMRVAGLGSPNDSGSAKDVGQEAWPASAKRLAKLAWAITFRVRKATGTVEASMALADDDVMLLCQGLEVLEALSDCSADFFEGRRSRLLFFEGDLAPILTTLRGCHDKNSMHPVVFDACSWVQSTA